MKLEVSTKHLKLRIVLFVVLFFVIVASFTIGVLNIGNKTSGYQSITADTDAEALTYNNLVLFKHWFGGSSNLIKREIKQLKSVYTPILAAAYKQLDPVNTYTGQVSLGTINSNIGSIVSVSPQLYAILQDAYGRTLEGKGFNMFAGALYSEWKSILILEDASEFDPLFNDYQAERISAIAQMVSDLSNFSLEFLDEATCSVRLNVSDDYRAFCDSYEITAPVLDLNVLTDAYRLEMMGTALALKGYRNGYLATQSGLVLNLGGDQSLDYGLYTLEGDSNVQYSSVSMKGRFCAAAVNAYGNGSDYGYSIESDGHTVYRSEFINPVTGYSSDVIMSLAVISDDSDLVDAMYLAFCLNNLESASAVQSAVKAVGSDYLVSYILQDAK